MFVWGQFKRYKRYYNDWWGRVPDPEQTKKIVEPKTEKIRFSVSDLSSSRSQKIVFMKTKRIKAIQRVTNDLFKALYYHSMVHHRDMNMIHPFLLASHRILFAFIGMTKSTIILCTERHIERAKNLNESYRILILIIFIIGILLNRLATTTSSCNSSCMLTWTQWPCSYSELRVHSSW